MGYPKIGKNRMEAFSDGVLAIIITIMVLELKAPHGDSLLALSELAPKFLSYILSFVYVAIYWNNHHHLLHTLQSVNGPVLWANLNLLFWLSLIPFSTAWMGENHFSTLPTQFYGVTLFMAGVAYYILVRVIVISQGPDSILKKALGSDWKGKLSPVLYLVAITLAFWSPWLAFAIFSIVALMWIVPDPRIAKLYHV